MKFYWFPIRSLSKRIIQIFIVFLIPTFVIDPSIAAAVTTSLTLDPALAHADVSMHQTMRSLNGPIFGQQAIIAPIVDAHREIWGRDWPKVVHAIGATIMIDSRSQDSQIPENERQFVTTIAMRIPLPPTASTTSEIDSLIFGFDLFGLTPFLHGLASYFELVRRRLISDIDPKPQPTALPVEMVAADLNRYVEPPVRKAVRILIEKGIKTLSSSANRRNIADPSYPYPGYAYIAIEHLSDENREILQHIAVHPDEYGVYIPDFDATGSAGEKYILIGVPVSLNPRITEVEQRFTRIAQELKPQQPSKTCNPVSPAAPAVGDHPLSPGDKTPLMRRGDREGDDLPMPSQTTAAQATSHTGRIVRLDETTARYTARYRLQIELDREREIQHRYELTSLHSGRSVSGLFSNTLGESFVHDDPNAADSRESMMQETARSFHAEYLGRSSNVFRFNFGGPSLLDIYDQRDQIFIAVYKARGKGGAVYGLALAVAQQLRLPIYSAIDNPMSLSDRAKFRWRKLVQEGRAFYDDVTPRFIAPVVPAANRRDGAVPPKLGPGGIKLSKMDEVGNGATLPSGKRVAAQVMQGDSVANNQLETLKKKRDRLAWGLLISGLAFLLSWPVWFGISLNYFGGDFAPLSFDYEHTDLRPIQRYTDRVDSALRILEATEQGHSAKLRQWRVPIYLFHSGKDIGLPHKSPLGIFGEKGIGLLDSQIDDKKLAATLAHEVQHVAYSEPRQNKSIFQSLKHLWLGDEEEAYIHDLWIQKQLDIPWSWMDRFLLFWIYTRYVVIVFLAGLARWHGKQIDHIDVAIKTVERAA